MSHFAKNAGLPSQFARLAIGVPFAVVGAALLIFLIEASVGSIVA